MFKLRKSLILMLFSIAPLLLGARNYYLPSPRQEGDQCKVIESVETDPKFGLPESLNQGKTGTCYGHAAYNLAQYHLNVEQILGSKLEKPDRLSLIDMMGIGCGKKKWTQGGQAFAVLQNIRNQAIYMNTPMYSAEFASRVSKIMSKTEPCKTEVCCTMLRQAFISEAPELLAEDLEGIISQITQDEKKKKSHKAVFSILKDKPDQGYLPDYNVHVFEPTTEWLTSSENSSLSKKTAIENQLRALLQPIAPHQVRYPVAFNFCPSEDAKGRCSEGAHAVAITGARKLCCGPNPTQCTEEWKIQNSYGGSQDGWHQAGPLIESMLKFHGDFTTIEPCRPSESTSSQASLSSTLSQLPRCQSHILGPYPIHYLIQANDFETLKSLLKQKSPHLNLSQNNSIGYDPLSFAIYEQNRKLARLLIEADTDKNFVNQNGLTPLISAIVNDLPDIGEALLAAGADPDKPGSKGQTPLQTAVTLNHLDWVKLLSKTNAKKNAPFELAVTLGRVESARVLVQAGADVNHKFWDGNSALLAAIEMGQVEMVKILLAAHARTDQPNPYGETPLLIGIEENYPEIVKALLKSGADPNQANRKGLTPLLSAASRGEIAMMNQLIQAGADLEKADHDGYTPLAEAVAKGKLKGAADLIKRNANPFIELKDGRSLEDLIPKDLGTESYAAIHKLITTYKKHFKDKNKKKKNLVREPV